jgi:hypothetical protein
MSDWQSDKLRMRDLVTLTLSVSGSAGFEPLNPTGMPGFPSPTEQGGAHKLVRPSLSLPQDSLFWQPPILTPWLPCQDGHQKSVAMTPTTVATPGLTGGLPGYLTNSTWPSM